MKFLDSPAIAHINAALNEGINVAEMSIHGRLEAYSCKLAANDKKIKKEVEQKIVDGLMDTEGEPSSSLTAGTSFGSFATPGSSWCSSSPLGNLLDSSTRKLLVDLILTLNSTYPDYDFTNVSPEDFCRERDYKMVVNSVNQKLARLDEVSAAPFCLELWTAVDEVISSADCQIYSYLPDPDDEQFSCGKLWSFNYFFFNKKTKKILFFACWCQGKHIAALAKDIADSSDDDAYDEMAMDDMEDE